MTTGETTPAFGGVRATWRARMRPEKMGQWFDLERSVMWSGEQYAARNPHWCGGSREPYGRVMWPVAFPDDWCCASVADIEFIEEVAEA